MARKTRIFEAAKPTDIRSVDTINNYVMLEDSLMLSSVSAIK